MTGGVGAVPIHSVTTITGPPLRGVSGGHRIGLRTGTCLGGDDAHKYAGMLRTQVYRLASTF